MKRIRLLMVLIGSLVFAQTAPADWSAVRRITWTSGGSYSPAIAVDSSGYLHVVWLHRKGTADKKEYVINRFNFF